MGTRTNWLNDGLVHYIATYPEPHKDGEPIVVPRSLCGAKLHENQKVVYHEPIECLSCIARREEANDPFVANNWDIITVRGT